MMKLDSLPASNTHTPSLEEIGFEGVELQRLKIAANSPVGLIVVAGMSDSLPEISTEACVKIAAQSYASAGKIRIMPQDIETNFRRAFQMLLRSEPDVLVMNEVGNVEQFTSAISAAVSGHKTLATIQAESAFRIISRMTANGVNPDDVKAKHTISALVYQASLDVLCRDCSLGFAEAKAVDPSENGVEQFQRYEYFMQPEHRQMLRFRNHSGCEHCQNGITGKTVVAEVLTPDESLMELLITDRWEDAMTHFRSQGGRTIFDNALSKVLRGMCDLSQVESKIDVMRHQVVMRRGGAVSLYDHSPENIPAGALSSLS